MDLDYLQPFKGFINKLSVKYQKTPKEIEEIIDHFFRWLKKSIQDPRMPTLKIFNFGTFKPSLGIMNSSLWRYFKFYRLGKKGSRKWLTRKIRKLWPIRRRLMNEKHSSLSRPDLFTWKRWSKMTEEEIEKLKSGKWDPSTDRW